MTTADETVRAYPLRSAMASSDQMQLGIAALDKSVTKAGLTVIQSDRRWNGRRATYFVIGKTNRRTDVVLSDEFVSDLPGTSEPQTALDSYVSAVAGRVFCGSPESFYCQCGIPVRMEINWPIRSGASGSTFFSVLLIHVINLANESVAKCSVPLNGFPFGSTEIDTPRLSVNRIRKVLDRGTVVFFTRPRFGRRHSRK